MKKLFTLFLSSAVALGVFAQSPRNVLFEEFSGENCGPCAAVNPYITDFAEANPSNLILLKYQAPIPSAGPIYNQNTSDVAARRSYYGGVNSAPYAKQDGLDFSASGNHPAYWFDGGDPTTGASAIFTARAAVTSPCALTVTHTFSADYDSCYVSVTVNFTQAYAAGGANKLKLRLALVEKLMAYETPPGTNGETEFHNVMRDLVPNPTGTQMPDNNAVGTQTFNFGVAIPAYIKSKGQIAFVAFAQDDQNKEVLNAAISSQQLLSLDAEATGGAIGSYVTCNTDVYPTVTFKNLGSQTLTTANIIVKLNGTQVSSTPWTGSVATDATFQPTVPAVSGLISGNNGVQIILENPNGGTDNDANNNAKMLNVVFNNAASATTPFVEDFETGFPAANSYIYNPDAAATFEQSTTAGSSGTKSLKMDYYFSADGSVDHFYMPRIDLTSSQVAFMTFKRAAAQYNTSTNDRMEIQVSKDCGATWYTVWDKQGSNLATTNATTSDFTPVANQWVEDSANLTFAAGEANVLVRFKATSNYGNNAYFDQINIYKRAAGVGINDLAKNISSLQLYPNPTTDVLNVAFNIENAEPVTISIVDAIGNVLYTSTNQTPALFNQQGVDVSTFSQGLYFVNVVSESGKATAKFFKN